MQETRKSQPRETRADLMKTLSIDIETYCEADLNRSGVYRYDSGASRMETQREEATHSALRHTVRFRAARK